jgi:hypothetical protein
MRSLSQVSKTYLRLCQSYPEEDEFLAFKNSVVANLLEVASAAGFFRTEVFNILFSNM